MSTVKEETHPVWMGYVLWIFGFMGAHRFYYGKKLTGILWALTAGLLFIGWIVDLFLIPGMAKEANARYRPAKYSYTAAWLLLLLLGVFGIHRFYLGRWITGLLWLCTGGLLFLGVFFDLMNLNEMVETERS